MLNDIFRHLRYFLPKTLGYGTVIGALFGGLTYPILGTLIGLPWGFAAGLALGILMGIGIPIYNRFFAPEDDDIYRNHLTYGIGFLSLIVMALPLLFIYALPLSMVAAYLAHQYADNPQLTDEKRKHTVDAYQRRDKVFTYAANAFMSKARYVIGLAVGVALLAYIAVTASGIEQFLWEQFFGLGIGGVIYGFTVAGFVAAVNGLFVVFANRLFFTPDTPKSVYKPRIVALVGMLTLFLSMIVTLGIGAPFAAIAGAWGAAKYADWYYDGAEDKKAKRGHSRLEDDYTAEDDFDYAGEDEHIHEMVRRN